MKRRTEKARKRAAEKKSRKEAAMRRTGTSKYAMKAKRAARGEFSKGSPFRSAPEQVAEAA
jgi:hypothetical protein